MDVSKLWTLNWFDVGKGLLVAVLSAVLTVVYQSIEAGSLAFNWKAIGLVASAAAVSYLMKQLGTGVDGKILSK